MLFDGNTNLYQINLPANLYRIYNRVAVSSRNLLKIEIPSRCAIMGSSTSAGYSAFYYTKTYIMFPATPPSVGRFDTAPTDIYVPNESIITYRGASVWSGHRGKIYGFVSGPIEIMRDGQYQYKLQSCFSDATDFSLTIQDNEYLRLEFSEGIGIITATGITSDLEDTSVRMNYGFNYKGTQHSGSFEIALKYRETIDFEDAEVKRICVANWGGEYSSSTNKYGVPGELTYEQAAAVTSIGKVFNGNTKITSFMEFQYFTSLISNSLYAAAVQNIPFYNCRNLKKIKVPEGITYINGLFRNCASLVFIELPSTLTDTIRYYTFGGNPSTPANKKLVVHFNNPLQLQANGVYGTYCGTFNRGIYVPDEYIDEFRAADVWKDNNIYPLSEWDGTT